MTKKQREIISSKIRELRPLRGKRILDVVLNPCLESDGLSVTFNPVMIVDDGTQVRFRIQESEEWSDGVSPYIQTTN